MLNRILLSLFALLSIVHLGAEYAQLEWLILSTKPLLVSLLAVWFWRSTRGQNSTLRKFLLLGLIFSVGGDTLLMFVEYGPRLEVFFLLGLGSFLIAQLCYAYGLHAYAKNDEGAVGRNPWILFFFLGYLAGILVSIWSGIPRPMRVPVTIYATAIVAMAVSAANLFGQIPIRLFLGFFGGVLLFVLSDSLIAINKFGTPFAGARLAIMSTYIFGQLLIAVYGSRIVQRI